MTRHQMPEVGELSQEELRDDPGAARAYRLLALRVFDQALMDLRVGNAEERTSAWRFLQATDPEAGLMRALWQAHVDDLISLDDIAQRAVECRQQ